jgi:hypothetical protein
MSADVIAAPTTVSATLKWRAAFAIGLYRHLKHSRIATILELMTRLHVTHLFIIQRLWKIRPQSLEVYEAVLREVYLGKLTCETCRAGMSNVKQLITSEQPASTSVWVHSFLGERPPMAAALQLPSVVTFTQKLKSRFSQLSTILRANQAKLKAMKTTNPNAIMKDLMEGTASVAAHKKRKFDVSTSRRTCGQAGRKECML